LTYLLDTNVCIALINQRLPGLRRRFERARSGDSEILVSAVAAFELWYGVEKSTRPQANMKLVETFFAGPVGILPFDHEDARSAGRIRASLQTAGTPIGPYDVLIAGQAVRRNLTLVTANAREFGRIQGLAWEDWSKS